MFGAIKLIRLFAALAIVLSGCAALEAGKIEKAGSHEPEDAFLRDMVASVRTGDGMDYSGAMSIAKYYLARFGRSQAIVTRMEDKGKYWEADVAMRYAGFSNRSMIIDKSTGGVTWFQGPTTRSIQELLAK